MENFQIRTVVKNLKIKEINVNVCLVKTINLSVVHTFLHVTGSMPQKISLNSLNVRPELTKALPVTCIFPSMHNVCNLGAFIKKLF